MPPDPSPLTAADRTDEDLMLAYAAGDAAAFERLYGRHKGGVYRYLLRLAGSSGAVDELFQDVWLNIVRARHQYEPTAKFTTYLYRIAHNRVIDYWRSQGVVTLVADSGDSEDDDAPGLLDSLPAPATSTPDRQTESKAIKAAIDAALGALPAVQREAFLLQQEGGMSLAEIAASTGVNEETAKSRLRYAVSKLRASLKAWVEA